MRLAALALAALPALALGQAPAPASTTTQTSTAVLTKTVFLSRVQTVTSTQYNSTSSYMPTAATGSGFAAPTAAATAATSAFPGAHAVGAAASLDARGVALTGLVAALALPFL